jgi:signal transduction histidine kinase
MKKKIFIGLGVASALFTLCGIYLIVTVERTTSKLDKLVKLHQVEILREHLLIQVKGVQSGLTLTGTPYAIGVDAIVSRTIRMGKVADQCFMCHHEPPVLENLKHLKAQIEDYKGALSRVLTLGANESRLAVEKDQTIRIGEKLISSINGVIAMTSTNLALTTKAAFREIATTKTLLFVLIASGPLFLMTFGTVSVRAVTRPVSELLTATRRLKGGDLDHRVGGLKDEFGELAISFNEMAASLKEQMLRMQRTEQMVVVGELAAGLGHELKNPLAGIKAAINILSDELDLEGDDQVLFRQIVEQIGRLEALMKSFINFAKPPKPQWETVDVNRVVETTLDFYATSGRPQSQSSQSIRIVRRLAEALPAINADPIQLQQVLLNLVLNAVDAMPDGGTLAVETRHDVPSRSVHVQVSDTGKGIEPAMAGKMFQPFFTTKPNGTGLGLAMCKQLIEQHGGSLQAENGPSGGAVFRIVLQDRGDTGHALETA